MKLISPRAVDVCLYFPSPGRKGTANEADCHAVKWSTLIARPEYVAVRDHADVIYRAVAAARSDCPDVREVDGGLSLLWTNQGRSLFVKVVPGPLVQFTMGADTGVPLRLQTVANFDALGETFFKLGRYVSGLKESACYSRPSKV